MQNEGVISLPKQSLYIVQRKKIQSVASAFPELRAHSVSILTRKTEGVTID